MNTHHVPVRTPVGKVEWAGTTNFLYGIDSEGTVFRFEPYAGTPPQPGFSTVIRALKGLFRG